MHKIVQSGWFLGRLLGQLLNIGLPLKICSKTKGKSVLITLGLAAVASATGAAIHKKIFGSSFTRLIISNEEINDIIKTVKSLEESGLLIKGVSETSKMKRNNKKED